MDPTRLAIVQRTADKPRAEPSDETLLLPGAAAVGLAVGAVVGAPAALVVAGFAFVAFASVASVAAWRSRRDPFEYPLRPEVLPSEVLSLELRDAYVSMLLTHETVRRSLRGAPHARDMVGHLYRRAGEIVQCAGQLARGANPMQRFLDLDPALSIDHEIGRLEESVGAASDPETAIAYGRALAARRHQRAARRNVATLCQRIRARLEMATASIAMLGAVAVELGGEHAEHAMAAAGELAEHADALSENLEMLETMFGSSAMPALVAG
jgi:hypothetical protein